MSPDPKILVAYAMGALSPLSKLVAQMTPTTPSSPQDASGESLARQRKVAIASPCVPYGRAIGCNCDYRGPQCCNEVLQRQCDPPRAVRMAFGEGYKGGITNRHLRIARGDYRDERGVLD